MKKILLLKWNSIVLVLVSILLAVVILEYRNVFNYKPEYEILSYLFKDYFYISALLLFGVVKMIGIIFNQLFCRRVGLIGLNVSWALLTYALAVQHINGSTNFGWVYTLGILLFAIGITIQEQFHA